MTKPGLQALRAGRWFAAIGSLAIAACSTPPGRAPEAGASAPASRGSPAATASIPPRKSGGGYYLDDGPGDSPPPNLDLLPDAVPRVEKYASGANRPYNVFGVDYVPDLTGAPYRQRGTGSWYGRKFHGQRTSSGEIYDMYAMTAAHPTLPIPCYALVTNLQNGRSVIVRVNDRGPFLHNRVMDLSYAAALKVGYLSSGSGQIEVEMLQPADIAAGRIPVTTNSLYIANAAAGGSRSAPPPTTVVATTAAPTTAPTTVPAIAAPIEPLPPIAAMDGPNTSASAPAGLPSSYADRGIPPDLIPDTEPAARLTETATGVGLYLQLGAFRVKAGADSFAAHVAREIDPALASRVQVAGSDGLYRVRVGPYAQRAEADTAAASLRAAISQPVLILPAREAR